MMHENLDLSDINQVLHVVRNPYGWNEHVVRDARLKLADEFERLRAEVDALRSENWSLKCEVAGQLGERQALLQRTEEAEADAERYRAMRREKGGMMSDIDKAIRLINDWNHNKKYATHGHAVWVGLKLIHEVEQLRAEVDALRSENWSLKCEVAGQLGERQALLQRTEEAEADAERYRWLTEDHDSKEMRNRCLEILSRMPVMSYSAACAAIDAARKGE
jgi:FtsZ-binding cell division protein ZapB